MAKVGKTQLGDELLDGIVDHADQVYGRLVAVKGILDPHPRDFVIAGLELKAARERNELPPLPRDVVVGTFRFLVPDVER